MSEPFDEEAWLTKQQGRASEIVRQTREFYRSGKARCRKGYEVELLVATSFGIHRAQLLFPHGPDLLFLSVTGGGEFDDTIFAPVEQCAFMLRHFRPTQKKPRIIVGFAPQNE